MCGRLGIGKGKEGADLGGKKRRASGGGGDDIVRGKKKLKLSGSVFHSSNEVSVFLINSSIHLLVAHLLINLYTNVLIASFVHLIHYEAVNK